MYLMTSASILFKILRQNEMIELSINMSY